jgi:D-alanine-D-alanine ligase
MDTSTTELAAAARASLGDCASELANAHVVVLYGGTSSEREISLVTGRDVATALAKPDDDRGPRRVSAIEIDAQGRWVLADRALAPAEALHLLQPVDVVFLGLHGGTGENGSLQGWLELESLAYTGSGAQASALCMDKLALRGVVAQRGIPVAPGVCVRADEWRRDAGGVRARIAALAADGWIVKPRNGGSSVATNSVAAPSALGPALESVFEIGDDALVEARVAGVEVSCGVLDTGERAPRALAPVEIQPRQGAFFDYAEKYSSGGAVELCPPRSLGAAEIARVQAHAVAAHQAARCAGYSRTDFIVPAHGEPVLLEVNTLPGLTPRSLLPQEALVAGIDYRTLCLWIAADGLRRGPRGR